ncbi:MAG: hypothetical protein PHN84_02315 [Desulfuromonadaceae bacterium]|nr:hypothetical protein [Desulfuromonadaceae bacterium]MDD2856224.1 hypothetical protein [Desulfuromonadaceae bacterium]
MICGFCGYKFEESEGKSSCGGCSGGCHSIHCPRCNYKNPLESGVVRKLKSIFGKKPENEGEKQ